MSDFAPPAGPPPPKVPAGWKAQFNSTYNEWFYVNIYTKKSQWEKPTEPVYSPPGDDAPPGPPPGYSAGPNAAHVSDTKAPLSSNNPYGSGSDRGSSAHDSDAQLAARLQAEEDARARGSHSPLPGAASDYYSQPGQQQPYGAQSPYGGQSPYPAQSPQPQGSDRGSGSKGFLGKLLGKGKQSSSYGNYPPQGYPQQGYQQQGPPQGYGGYPAQQGYGGYPQQGYYQQQPPKKSGMGAGGAAALGVGGGLLGGMLLADAMDGGDHSYDQGYDQGYDNGADNGGDYGGGDMGGDMGGGDF